MAYSLDVANNTISNMGLRGIGEGGDEQLAQPPADVGPSIGIGGDIPLPSDPLLDFGKEEMARLCRVHEEEVGVMYPVIDINVVINHSKSIAPHFEAMKKQRSHKLNDEEKTLQLKMVLCSGLVLEGHGQSDRATRLYESMEDVVNRKLMSDVSSVANLPLLALLAGYRFLSNDEILAWRVIGQVGRLCLELGIHRHNALMKIKDEQERKNALMSFWTAYFLDRRWAFGTGLPYVIQDDEIDPKLPLPVSCTTNSQDALT